MSWRILGAGMIIAACGSCGYLMAFQHRRCVRILQQLLLSLDHMESELIYRMTPLPDLCRKTAQACSGVLSDVFVKLCQELESQISPNVSQCMSVVLDHTAQLPQSVAELLRELGLSIGEYNLEGQLRGIAAVRKNCQRIVEIMEKDQDARLRSYQILGLCAGAAIVIVLF